MSMISLIFFILAIFWRLRMLDTNENKKIVVNDGKPLLFLIDQILLEINVLKISVLEIL